MSDMGRINLMMKMYIAVLDEAPDYMVPTLVAHSVMNAHDYFKSDVRHNAQRDWYDDWHTNSFRKVVVKVPRKIFDKIHSTMDCWAGYERTICDGATSCLVVHPVLSDDVPNVLKYTKLWKPETNTPPLPRDVPNTKQVDYRALPKALQDKMSGELYNLYNLGRFFKAHAALESGVYVVQPGDTLSQIAEDLGMDWQELAQFNGLTKPGLIFPGQAIRLR